MRHTSMACSHRGWNGQHSGMLIRLGGVPWMEYSRSPVPRSSRGTERISPRVYGCFGSAKMTSVAPRSTTRPAYITLMRSHIPETTPRSWVIRITAVPSLRDSSLMISRIWAWIVTSSAVVGSSAIRTSGLHERAMAIMTRWRMPPENWWG